MSKARVQLVINGAVQGVGLRPFIYNQACELSLNGFVQNTPQGVVIEVEGEMGALQKFLSQVQAKKPPQAYYQTFHYHYLDANGYSDFEIKESVEEGVRSTQILPDIATCPDCLNDILDSNNRRHQYPFTNCTNCGPRYSIIQQLPYDRASTSMKDFTMCVECQKEYNDPEDRRFHAQPNACSECGPQLSLVDQKGKVLAEKEAALTQAVKAVKNGQIVAVKGLGGFHLMADANNEKAVQELRERKSREEKPFAIMAPSLDWVKLACHVSDVEEQLLQSSEAPIVLLLAKDSTCASSSVAPENPYLGVMLAYTPLHHLLMKELDRPVVATSANFTDDPICFDEKDAIESLKDVADVFLIHDRPILHPVDDSIVRVIDDQPMMMRRARGYAPAPVIIDNDLPEVLALGGYLKNTVAYAKGNNIMASPHIGNLETPRCVRIFDQTISSMQEIYQVKDPIFVCDKHPDYYSHQKAHQLTDQPVKVQHHHAHIVSCMAENNITGEVFGLAWDGTGLGDDGTIWGGEFLIADEGGFTRAAWFDPFPLPGGEAAMKQPCRSALGLLWHCYDGELSMIEKLPCFPALDEQDKSVLKQMLDKNIQAPLTSSVGRLFDAVAALVGLSSWISFEGQAAMALEFEAMKSDATDIFPFTQEEEVIVVKEMIQAIVEAVSRGEAPAHIARTFHNTLVQIGLTACQKSRKKRVVLSGGCFQNRILTEGLIQALKQEGFQVYRHQLIPPNDGGLAVGQAVIAGQLLKQK